MTTTPLPSTVSLQTFRDAMATVASPVAVVTAMDGPCPHGTTVSAFASLSLAPPMVLVSLNNRSHLLAIIRRTFLQLEALTPGRIDLGLGRATAGPVADLALRRDRDVPPADDFTQQVQEVLAHFDGRFPAGQPFARLNPAAGVASRPEVWILGSSGNSARMAGELGLDYAFAGFINPDGASRALLRHAAFAQSAAPRSAGGRREG
ncbi:LLM class flavin-dependent oxidoreductase [Streptomyces canus]|uniref:LLM class flavin-dependent oxidoreductase n=1 Tax=Streptomyces canus TaxID=58343 RepID=UPI0036E2565C